jgi:hypothetical protein
MIDQLRFIVLVLPALAAFALLLVLPGASVADRWAGRAHSLTARLALSVVFSQVLLAAAGGVLVAIGQFSGALVAVVAVVLSAISVPALRRWARDIGPALPSLSWVALLAVPWVAFVGAVGLPPADTLQWYYAGLGAQLTQAGGIPVAVAEWGQLIRWLPDYLIFNVDSEAYLALLWFLPVEDALSAWRAPVVLLGLYMLVAVLRLWVGRSAAIVGATLVAGGTFYLAKFDAYKPEALGIVFGLIALWLAVRGVRSGRRSWVLVAGGVLGLGLSVHAIAATVMGLFVAAFAGAEWVMLRRDRVPRLGWLIRAAVLGLLISVVMGVGLQGRAVVASAALNPTTESGTDPTWVFFLRSTGNFAEPAPPPPQRPLAGGITSPWPGFRVASAFGWWLVPVIGVGLAFQFLLGGRRGRAGVVGLVGAGALLGAGILFFALAFDTYVPRWTGLVRFGQYAPLGGGLAGGMAVAGYLRAWGWLAEARVPRWLPLALAAAVLVWLLPPTVARYRGEVRISAPGEVALHELRDRSRPGDVVLSNVLTTGTIEMFTGTEVPLESRQPLIEESRLLAGADQMLLDAHRFFDDPTDRSLLDRLGVRWVLVADHPSILGASATLGGETTSARDVGTLAEVWSDVGISLFEVVDPETAAAVVDARESVVDLPRAAGAALAGLILGGAVVVPLSWRPALRRRPVRPPAGG